MKRYPSTDRTKAHAWFAKHGEGVRPPGQIHTTSCGFVQLLIEEHEEERAEMLAMLQDLESGCDDCGHCPSCGFGHGKHSEHCKLAALLAGKMEVT